MSGRLILLPKKSYTPWNPQNVERVERDERLHRERIQRIEEEDRKRNNLERIQRMKQNMATRGGGIIAESNHSQEADQVGLLRNDDSGIHKHKHLNLFEKEERERLQSILLGGDDSTTACSKKKTTNSKQNDNLEHQKEFYERKACLSKDIDEKVKLRMDPMSQFNLHQNDNGTEITNISLVEKLGSPRAQKQTNSKERKQSLQRCKTNSRKKYDDVDSDSSSTLHRRHRKKERKHRHRNREQSSKDGHDEERYSRHRRKRSKRHQKKESRKEKSKNTTFEELMKRQHKRDQIESERERDLVQKI
mmetsp:Transcript_15861/g.18426  ORF Transcript_15861/g.18426 Transcript_15861/m.18426 type:complete len:305 (-) Transcript_15861:47-961(-)